MLSDRRGDRLFSPLHDKVDNIVALVDPNVTLVDPNVTLVGLYLLATAFSASDEESPTRSIGRRELAGQLLLALAPLFSCSGQCVVLEHRERLVVVQIAFIELLAGHRLDNPISGRKSEIDRRAETPCGRSDR